MRGRNLARPFCPSSEAPSPPLSVSPRPVRTALIAAGADAAQGNSYAQALNDYDILVALGAALPRIRAMREYLLATGLHDQLDDDPRRDPQHPPVETDCKLLLVEVIAALQAKSTRTLDALE